MPGTRMLLRIDDDRFDLIEIGDIYYCEAMGGDTVVRTRRMRPYRTTERLAALAARLPADRFLRPHRSFLVNLDRLQHVSRRAAGGWSLKLDPPVNRVIPIARSHERDTFLRLGWKRSR